MLRHPRSKCPRLYFYKLQQGDKSTISLISQFYWLLLSVNTLLICCFIIDLKMIKFPFAELQVACFRSFVFIFLNRFLLICFTDSCCSVASSSDKCWLLYSWYSVASYWLQSIGTGFCSSWFCNFPGCCRWFLLYLYCKLLLLIEVPSSILVLHCSLLYSWSLYCFLLLFLWNRPVVIHVLSYSLLFCCMIGSKLLSCWLLGGHYWWKLLLVIGCHFVSKMQKLSPAPPAWKLHQETSQNTSDELPLSAVLPHPHHSVAFREREKGPGIFLCIFSPLFIPVSIYFIYTLLPM